MPEVKTAKSPKPVLPKELKQRIEDLGEDYALAVAGRKFPRRYDTLALRTTRLVADLKAAGFDPAIVFRVRREHLSRVNLSF